jgi:hypothetical protein
MFLKKTNPPPQLLLPPFHASTVHPHARSQVATRGRRVRHRTVALLPPPARDRGGIPRSHAAPGRGPSEMVNTFFLFCGCVDQASVAVVEKWGRFLRLADPGLHFFNPLAGECVAGSLTTRVQSLDVRVETKTKVRLAGALAPPALY